jgi:hypothetical protein
MKGGRGGEGGRGDGRKVRRERKGERKGRREGRRDGGREREKQSVIELPGLGDFLQKGNTRPLNELSSP